MSNKEPTILDLILDQIKQVRKISEDSDKRLDKIDVTLASQHVILDEHIKRTELLEQKMEHVDRHVNMVNGALKLIGFVGIVVALIEGLLHIFS